MARLWSRLCLPPAGPYLECLLRAPRAALEILLGLLSATGRAAPDCGHCLTGHGGIPMSPFAFGNFGLAARMPRCGAAGLDPALGGIDPCLRPALCPAFGARRSAAAALVASRFEPGGPLDFGPPGPGSGLQ